MTTAWANSVIIGGDTPQTMEEFLAQLTLRDREFEEALKSRLDAQLQEAIVHLQEIDAKTFSVWSERFKFKAAEKVTQTRATRYRNDVLAQQFETTLKQRNAAVLIRMIELEDSEEDIAAVRVRLSEKEEDNVQQFRQSLSTDDLHTELQALKAAGEETIFQVFHSQTERAYQEASSRLVSNFTSTAMMKNRIFIRSLKTASDGFWARFVENASSLPPTARATTIVLRDRLRDATTEAFFEKNAKSYREFQANDVEGDLSYFARIDVLTAATFGY